MHFNNFSFLISTWSYRCWPAQKNCGDLGCRMPEVCTFSTVFNYAYRQMCKYSFCVHALFKHVLLVSHYPTPSHSYTFICIQSREVDSCQQRCKVTLFPFSCDWSSSVHINDGKLWNKYVLTLFYLGPRRSESLTLAALHRFQVTVTSQSSIPKELSLHLYRL